MSQPHVPTPPVVDQRHCARAQCAALNVVRGVAAPAPQGDNEDVHFENTVRGSDWGADQRVVRMFVNTAPKAVRELAAWGVRWSRVARGDREVIINGQ